ncbi:MAG: outer membrane beta-barrel protein [Rhodomicrobium sp.]
MTKEKDDWRLFSKHALALIVVQSLVGSALAAPADIGTTVAVTNAVTLESGTSKQPLLKGIVVHRDEIIVTGIDAEAEVELLDQTKLAIGPEARVVLDKFVYDPSASSSISVTLSKGAFRFITGLAPKHSYEIRTPVAFVGTRGTVFDIYVGGGGETAVLLLQGAVEVCNLAGTCRLQNRIGSILFVGVDGVISRYSNCESSFIRQIGFRTAFPFIGKRLVIDPVQRMSLLDFECRPHRQPRVITAQSIIQPSPPLAGETGFSPEVLTWTGFYIGINGGPGWSLSSDLAAVFDIPPANPSGPANSLGFSSKFNATGGFGGGHIGYDWQRERIVYGFEADLQEADINGSMRLAGGGAFATADTSLDWFGTVRGRLGYTFGNALLYATGGFAFGGVEDKLTLVNPITNPPLSAASKNQTATGYSVGGGLESFFSSAWSVKIEYQYIDLGSDTLSTALISGETATAKFVHVYDTIRVGLNYHIPAGYEPLR